MGGWVGGAMCCVGLGVGAWLDEFLVQDDRWGVRGRLKQPLLLQVLVQSVAAVLAACDQAVEAALSHLLRGCLPDLLPALAKPA